LIPLDFFTLLIQGELLFAIEVLLVLLIKYYYHKEAAIG